MSVRDLTGMKFGKLTAIECAKDRRTFWICRCDCGNYALVDASKLINGHTKSCGCIKQKYDIKNKRIFNTWNNMLSRCDNGDRKDSKYYHDKAVAVCDEWKSDYHAFQDWALKNGYADNLTIDRIDSTGGYCPENCRWITLAEQQRNKKNNHLLTFNGVTKCLSEWAEDVGMPRRVLCDRINKLGWSTERALTEPARKKERKSRR